MDHTDTFVLVLTKIVNLLLKNGVFLEEWKMVILWPLLKKCGLELTDSD